MPENITDSALHLVNKPETLSEFNSAAMTS